MAITVDFLTEQRVLADSLTFYFHSPLDAQTVLDEGNSKFAARQQPATLLCVDLRCAFLTHVHNNALSHPETPDQTNLKGICLWPIDTPPTA